MNKIFRRGIGRKNIDKNSPWPTLKGGYREKGQHALGHIVKVEPIVTPFPFLESRFVNITLLIDQISAAKKVF